MKVCIDSVSEFNKYGVILTNKLVKLIVYSNN